MSHSIQREITEKYEQKCNANLPVEEQVEKLFTKHFGRSFIKSLIEYMNKDWAKEEGSLLEDRKIQMLINIIIAKFGSFHDLVSDFLASEFSIE